VLSDKIFAIDALDRKLPEAPALLLVEARLHSQQPWR
jgi:hypothetical protein